jgi:hypothetical protein
MMTARGEVSTWVDSVKRGWSDLAGPEATVANTSTALGSAAVGLVGAAAWAKRRRAGWDWTTIMAAMAADLVGGVYVNNTRASVRWYERAGQGKSEHFKFAALHVHPVVVSLADHRIGARENVAGWTLAQYSTVAPWFAWTFYPTLLMGHAAGSLRLDEDPTVVFDA